MRKKNKYRLLTVGLVAVMSFLLSDQMASAILDNNLNVVDLRDLAEDLPLDADSTTQILWHNWTNQATGVHNKVLSI